MRHLLFAVYYDDDEEAIVKSSSMPALRIETEAVLSQLTTVVPGQQYSFSQPYHLRVNGCDINATMLLGVIVHPVEPILLLAAAKLKEES